MFDLIATGMSAGTAGLVIDAVYGGMTVASALAIYAGLAGGAAYFVSNGLKALIKWAGRETIASW